MGRKITSGIKQRKRATVYLKSDQWIAMDKAHISVEHELGCRVDRTLFVDALFATGLNHPKEIQRLLGPCLRKEK